MMTNLVNSLTLFLGHNDFLEISYKLPVLLVAYGQIISILTLVYDTHFIILYPGMADGTHTHAHYIKHTHTHYIHKHTTHTSLT